MFEQTVGAGWKQYYSFNGQTVAMRDNAGTVTYLHGDHLGSVSLATNSSGALASQQEFDPWGAVRTGSVGQTGLNYTGQRLDATGLLYYHARMEDPVLARFVSADSVVPSGNPQALNRYAYVLNNPLRYTDPTGHYNCAVCENRGGGGAGPVSGGGGGAGANILPSAKQIWNALVVAATGAVIGTAAANNSEGNKQVAPASSDTGGQTGDPGGLDPNDPNNLDYLVANKNAVKVWRDTANSAQGKGADFEDYLQQQLKREGAFKAQSNRTGMIRQYDGAYNNGRIWYEAKNWDWSRVNLTTLQSDFGTRIRIAQEAGREFQLISQSAIPEEFKQWLLSKGASFREMPMP